MLDKNDLLFLDPLREVLSELKDEPGLPYPHGFFLPHVTAGYHNAPLKIFYYGMDTRWWMDTKELWGYENMMSMFNAGKIEDYICKWNNAWPRTTDEVLNWGNAVAFWPLVIRLHLLMTKNEWVKDLSKIPDHLMTDLLSFGYGNVYSVEQQASLQKEDWQDGDKKRTCWDAIDNIKAYKKAQKLTRSKILLKDVLGAFDPDCIFVHTWSWQEHVFFKDLEWRHHDVGCEGKFSAYTIKGYKTKILCTEHPNARGFDFYGTIPKAAEIMKRWLADPSAFESK